MSDTTPRQSRRRRLARVVDKMVASWTSGVGALDVGELFAEYLELRPGDRPALEALVAGEVSTGAVALRSYFEAKLGDAAVAADLDRLDALDAAAGAAPLAAGLTPDDLLETARVARKTDLRNRLRAECARVETLVDEAEAEARTAAAAAAAGTS